jgi:hypothetical protein
VHHADPHGTGLDDVLLRQQGLQRRLVHVPVDAFHRRAEAAELLEECQRDEVAGVEDEVCGAQELHARPGKRTLPAREMGV